MTNDRYNKYDHERKQLVVAGLVILLVFFFHVITFPFSLSLTHSLFALITHPRFGPLGATKGRPMPTIPQKTVNTITGTMPIFLQDIIYTDLDSNRTQKQSNETSKRSQGDDTNRFFWCVCFTENTKRQITWHGLLTVCACMRFGGVEFLFGENFR